jgi:hypothetical protein
MKSRKSVILVIALVGFMTSSNLFAQFSGGLELGLPMGNFSDIANVGFGISGKYEAQIKDKLSWTAGLGYLSFGGKSFLGGSFGSTSIVPLAGGIKYYFNEANNGLYAAGDLSINFISYSVAFPNQGNGLGVTFGTASGSKFGFSPGIGYRSGNWDFTGKFNLVGDFSYLGLRAAYIFGGK